MLPRPGAGDRDFSAPRPRGGTLSAGPGVPDNEQPVAEPRIRDLTLLNVSRAMPTPELRRHAVTRADVGSWGRGVQWMDRQEAAWGSGRRPDRGWGPRACVGVDKQKPPSAWSGRGFVLYWLRGLATTDTDIRLK